MCSFLLHSTRVVFLVSIRNSLRCSFCLNFANNPLYRMWGTWNNHFFFIKVSTFSSNSLNGVWVICFHYFGCRLFIIQGGASMQLNQKAVTSIFNLNVGSKTTQTTITNWWNITCNTICTINEVQWYYGKLLLLSSYKYLLNDCTVIYIPAQ